MQALWAKLNIDGVNSRIFNALRCEYATVLIFPKLYRNLLILNIIFNGTAMRQAVARVKLKNYMKSTA